MGYTDPRLAAMTTEQIRRALFIERTIAKVELTQKRKLRDKLNDEITAIEQRLAAIEHSENAL